MDGTVTMSNFKLSLCSCCKPPLVPLWAPGGPGPHFGQTNNMLCCTVTVPKTRDLCSTLYSQSKFVSKYWCLYDTPMQFMDALSTTS